MDTNKIKWLNANGILYHRPAMSGEMVYTSWHAQYNALSGSVEGCGKDYHESCDILYDAVKDALYGVCLVHEQER